MIRPRHHRHTASPADGILRIGLAIPLQGPAGIFGPSCEAVAELCAETLNTTGVLGCRVEIETIDAGAPPVEIVRRVRGLVRRGRIHALTGWHISSVRHHLVPEAAGRIPYAYTSLYEGGEHRSGLFCSGETPDLQIRPALEWMKAHHGARRWFIVGDDYVWPRRTAQAVVRFAHELDIQIAGTRFVRFGTSHFTAVMDELRRCRADGVLMLLVGQDAVAFNREFSAMGLDEEMIRLTPLMEENMLLASGATTTRGLYVAAGYFRSLATASSLQLIGDYTSMFGPEAPPLNNQAESCYEGIMLLAHLFRAARCTDVGCVTRSSEGLGYDGPRGAVSLSSGHLHQQVHIAQARENDFDVLATL